MEGTGTFLNGQEHGLFQAYDAAGTLLYTTEYIAGQRGATRFTQAGTEAMIGQANELLKEEGKRVTLRPDGDGRITVEAMINAPNPEFALDPRALKSVRAQLRTSVCQLLSQIPNLNSINWRELWADGTPGLEETVERSECSF